jgi:hypothetical protein
MLGSTLRKSRGDSDAPPDAAHPVVPPADSDDLITLLKLVLSRMDDDEAATFTPSSPPCSTICAVRCSP